MPIYANWRRAVTDQNSWEKPIRWGILGAGWIASQLASDIGRTPGNVLVAVGAREQHRAAGFAERFGASRAYGDYQQLVADEAVDVIYVATTHPGHREQAMLAFEAGKAALIEKPLCINATDTRLVFEAARTAGVFAMEAMWMRTNPLIRRAEALIAEGTIGALVTARADFGVKQTFDRDHRLYDLANGGGALLDLGIYPVTFAWLFLGRPATVSVSGILSPTGSDATVALQWGYSDGRAAQLWCSASAVTQSQGLLVGEDGWIRFEGGIHRPSALTVMSRGAEFRIEDPIGPDSPGYGPEIDEVARCLRAGLLESPLIPHADTIAIMELLDDARAELGVRYPGE